MPLAGAPWRCWRRTPESSTSPPARLRVPPGASRGSLRALHGVPSGCLTGCPRGAPPDLYGLPSGRPTRSLRAALGAPHQISTGCPRGAPPDLYRLPSGRPTRSLPGALGAPHRISRRAPHPSCRRLLDPPLHRLHEGHPAALVRPPPVPLQYHPPRLLWAPVGPAPRVAARSPLPSGGGRVRPQPGRATQTSPQGLRRPTTTHHAVGKAVPVRGLGGPCQGCL